MVPLLFRGAGDVRASLLRAPATDIIDALREQAVFGVDTAMRLAHGFGFLSAGDVHAYLRDTVALTRLAEAGLIGETPHHDSVLVRPWAGPARLLTCVVSELPLSREVEGGYRVVTATRLRQELVGAVGARAELDALLERAERKLETERRGDAGA